MATFASCDGTAFDIRRFVGVDRVFGGDRGPVASYLDDALSSDVRLCIADVVVTEVLQGFRRDRDFELARRTLAGVERLPLSYATYVDAARLYRKLRSRGVTAKTVDCIIAQACLDARASLLTADDDFAAMAKHTKLALA